MASKSKKSQTQLSVEDVGAVSDVTISPLDQEVRLAEAHPGDIEALESALDTAQETLSLVERELSALEEITLVQEESIRRQQAEITFNNRFMQSYTQQLTNVPERLLQNPAFTHEPITYYATMTAQLEELVTQLITKLEDTQTTQVTQTQSSLVNRKSQLLAILNPNNANTFPGPHVAVTQLAAAASTNNRNISSILSGIRSLGYAIATDELGRKYITSYTPNVSQRGAATSAGRSSTSTSQIITPDQLLKNIV